jgi:hypothetical protein
MTEQKAGSQLDLQNNDPKGEPASNGDKETELRPSLADRMMIAALTRVGYVLKPYPNGERGADVAAALEVLKARHLIHYPAECPNLTAAGLVVARRLAADEG